MTRRTREEIDRGRADIMMLLGEVGPLETHMVLARVLGYETTDAMWKGYSTAQWAQMADIERDLRELRRRGRIVSRRDPARYQVVWRVATDADLDAESDELEVARMEARWEPAS